MRVLKQRTNSLARQLWAVDPHAVDALVAFVFTAVAFADLAGRAGNDDVYRRDDAFGVILVLLQTVPIALRRVAPITALTVSVGAISLHIAVGYQGVPAGTFAALVILYSAASSTDVRRGIYVGLVAAAGITIYFLTDRGDPSPAQAVTTYATYAVGWGLGIYARSRREYTNVVEERAILLEREREVRAREAVADERARIARELHDMVGHALNLIVIQAGGAQRVFDSKPGIARDTLATIELTGRQALGDIERMLGILRDTDEADGLNPQPSLSHIGALASGVSEAGLPVRVSIEGRAVPLPSSVELSAYRIIQEALTNSLKHAAASQAEVIIRYAPSTLELEVTDDGRGPSAIGSSGDEGGRGIIGMKERIGLFGGELSVGPRIGGGYRVHATIPLEGGAT